MSRTLRFDHHRAVHDPTHEDIAQLVGVKRESVKQDRSLALPTAARNSLRGQRLLICDCESLARHAQTQIEVTDAEIQRLPRPAAGSGCCPETFRVIDQKSITKGLP